MHEIPSEQFIDLDLVQQRLSVVYANQYDNDNVERGVNNVIHCYIYENGVIYNLTGYTMGNISLEIKRPSGTAWSVSIDELGGTVSGNCITFPIKNEFTNLYGRYGCRFKLTNGNDIKFSSNFYLRVYKAPVQQEDVEDDTRFDDFNERIGNIEMEIENMNQEYISSTTPSNAIPNDFWTKLL